MSSLEPVASHDEAQSPPVATDSSSSGGPTSTATGGSLAAIVTSCVVDVLWPAWSTTVSVTV